MDTKLEEIRARLAAATPGLTDEHDNSTTGLFCARAPADMAWLIEQLESKDGCDNCLWLSTVKQELTFQNDNLIALLRRARECVEHHAAIWVEPPGHSSIDLLRDIDAALNTYTNESQ